MTISWADLSHYQTNVTLPVYAARHDRVGLKITEGTGYTDDVSIERYRWCKANGLPAVLYHFDRARFGGAAQFDYFLDTVKRAGGPRPGLDLLCHDVEDTDNPANAAASAAAFSNHAAHLGYAGCVYTGVWYANPHLITAGILHPSWRRLWLSDYGQAPDGSMRLPNGWDRSQVIARQFTSTAAVPGVGTPADYNRVLVEWLGAPTEGDVAITEAEFSRIRQELITVLADPTHQYLQDELAPLKAALAQTAGQIAALTALAGQAGGLDAATAHQIAVDAAKEAVDGITITVHDGPTP